MASMLEFPTEAVMSGDVILLFFPKCWVINQYDTRATRAWDLSVPNNLSQAFPTSRVPCFIFQGLEVLGTSALKEEGKATLLSPGNNWPIILEISWNDRGFWGLMENHHL
jgi:hypothetical protein